MNPKHKAVMAGLMSGVTLMTATVAPIAQQVVTPAYAATQSNVHQINSLSKIGSVDLVPVNKDVTRNGKLTYQLDPSSKAIYDIDTVKSMGEDIFVVNQERGNKQMFMPIFTFENALKDYQGNTYTLRVKVRNIRSGTNEPIHGKFIVSEANKFFYTEGTCLYDLSFELYDQQGRAVTDKTFLWGFTDIDQPSEGIKVQDDVEYFYTTGRFATTGYMVNISGNMDMEPGNETGNIYVKLKAGTTLGMMGNKCETYIYAPEAFADPAEYESLKIYVTNEEDGKPVGGLTFEDRENRISGTTDSNGSTVITRIKGKDGYKLSCKGIPEGYTLDGSPDVPAGTTEVHYKLIKKKPVEKFTDVVVTVVDGKGNPLSGVNLYCDGLFEDKTGEDGTFTTKVKNPDEEKTYIVMPNKDGYTGQPGEFTVNKDSSKVEVKILMDKNNLHFSIKNVADDGTTPIQGAEFATDSGLPLGTSGSDGVINNNEYTYEQVGKAKLVANTAPDGYTLDSWEIVSDTDSEYGRQIVVKWKKANPIVPVDPEPEYKIPNDYPTVEAPPAYTGEVPVDPAPEPEPESKVPDDYPTTEVPPAYTDEVPQNEEPTPPVEENPKQGENRPSEKPSDAPKEKVAKTLPETGDASLSAALIGSIGSIAAFVASKLRKFD